MPNECRPDTRGYAWPPGAWELVGLRCSQAGSPSLTAGPPNRPMKRNSLCSVLWHAPGYGSGATRRSRGLLEIGLGCGFQPVILNLGWSLQYGNPRARRSGPACQGRAKALRGAVRLSAALGGPLPVGKILAGPNRPR